MFNPTDKNPSRMDPAALDRAGPNRSGPNVHEELLAIVRRFRRVAPAAQDWSLRLVEESRQGLSVRRNIVQPLQFEQDIGAMITVVAGGGMGYAATGDLSPAGLHAAAGRARDWALRTAGYRLFDPAQCPSIHDRAHHHANVEQPWEQRGPAAKLERLRALCERLKIHDEIVDWSAGFAWRQCTSVLASAAGGEILQDHQALTPWLRAVANRGGETQVRSFGLDLAGQGGLERLDRLQFDQQPERVATEALALLDAPQCPSGPMDLLLMPGQMILQIHESIGHPLELDRILGDERNYAGGSFVTPAMFGHHAYGSELLNVSFDPTVPGELASYAYDDEGQRAERVDLIRNGILLRGLGGGTSQARSGLPGAACARASSWNRPPIDRMANLNLEPGTSRLEDLIGQVRHGVLMDSNRSWSIDDSRNKFQFGCEIGWRIEDGTLRGLVRNPSYRGISSDFWHRLIGVGDREASRVMGVGTCGKGEPNQLIAVGHASPPCLFRGITVFGGGAD